MTLGWQTAENVQANCELLHMHMPVEAISTHIQALTSNRHDNWKLVLISRLLIFYELKVSRSLWKNENNAAKT